MMEYKALKDIAQITMGQSPDSSSYNEEGNGLPFFQGNADFGELYPTERVWCSAPKKVAKANDILISVRAPIGALNYAREECCIGRGLATISIDDPAERQYIFHLLKARHDELNIKGTGSTFKAISKGVLEDLQVPVISPAEKQHAMQIMDSAEHIIRKRKEELQRFDELIKARFVEMFGDQFEAQKIKVGDIADVYIGLTYKPDNVSEIGTIVLRSGNIQNQSLQIERGVVRVSGVKIAEDKYVRDKDILMCARNGSAKLVGKSCLIRHPEEEMAFGAFMSVIRTEYPYFLQGFFSSDYFKNQLTNVGTTSVNQITSKMLKNYSVIKPMKNQEKDFSVFCAQVDKSKVAIQKSLDETKLLFDSLMQKYFG